MMHQVTGKHIADKRRAASHHGISQEMPRPAETHTPQHTCMMVVSPSLAKRTHLRSPIAAAFLRSKGVSRGLGWVPVMSVPAGRVNVHVKICVSTTLPIAHHTHTADHPMGAMYENH